MFYANEYCCNCEQRKSELLLLFSALKTQLYNWENSTEYFSNPQVRQEPMIDYGTGHGSMGGIVSQVINSGMSTECIGCFDP